MPITMTVQEIFARWRSGKISQTQAETALGQAWLAAGYTQAQRQASYQEWLDLLRTTPRASYNAEFAAEPTVPPKEGPIQHQFGANFDAKGDLIANWGPRPEIVDPEAGFRRGLAGAGFATGLGTGEFGRYLESRFAPTWATFGARGALGGNVGEDPKAFEKYAQATRGGGLGQPAWGAITGLGNILRGGGVGPEMENWAALQKWLAPSNETERGTLGDLAREAARTKYGALGTRYFMPSNEELIRQWETGPTGAQTTDLLPFLQRAFGLY